MRHGFLLIHKPAGPTSHDIVQTVRRRLNEGKIGHLGTLDPAAEGLLVLAVGAKALKVVELFGHLSKEYVADIRLGATSSTYDREGVIDVWQPVAGWEPPDLLHMRSVIEQRFLGKIRQVPPAHSAVKVGGERAYRKARQGRNVDLAAREVEITACAIESYDYPTLRLKVACGSGTYIRSLAHDLGQVLRCGAYLAGLLRTRVGEWKLEDAASPEEAAWSKVIPLKEILAPARRAELSDPQLEDVRCGRSVPLEIEPDTIAWHGGLPVAILIPCKDGTRASRARKVL
ncbi:MAG: tRNA pseudouridine(55) synthase TruB [Candidatus Peribacteraceae bacterium]|nr:tRNA pseudouridine(55) synthase TruB [Candidatus Peribacteraceae bacterium]